MLLLCPMQSWDCSALSKCLTCKQPITYPRLKKDLLSCRNSSFTGFESVIDDNLTPASNSLRTRLQEVSNGSPLILLCILAEYYGLSIAKVVRVARPYVIHRLKWRKFFKISLVLKKIYTFFLVIILIISSKLWEKAAFKSLCTCFESLGLRGAC